SIASRKPEMLIAYGEPAEEVAKVATDRNAGLIVMGLHSSPLLGPRMGSVTYRVLCLAHRLVLALPPGSTSWTVLIFLMSRLASDGSARRRFNPASASPI